MDIILLMSSLRRVKELPRIQLGGGLKIPNSQKKKLALINFRLNMGFTDML
jgi:hypothetical protein